MDAPTHPTPGYTIRGYQLEKRLGTGKLTTLYHARTEELWLPPELTIMFLHLPLTFSVSTQRQFAERFTREASRLSKLRHPSLHPLFGYGEEGGQLYLLFPTPLPSTTLARYLRRHTRWSPAEAFSILAPLSSAFDYLHHEGVAYQFFTPSNVLLQEHAAPQITGTGLLQLLTMQGLADELDSGEPYGHLKNVAGDYMSLSTYLAPEVIRGEPATTRSDVYSLGILLFELLSGKPPFTGETYTDIAQKHLREPLPSLHALAPTVPVALELIVNRALHRNPEHRFATVGALVTAFSHVLNERLRSSAYLSLKPIDAKKQTRILPVPTQELDAVPLLQTRLANTRRTTPQTSAEMPIIATTDETYTSTADVSNKDTFNDEILTADVSNKDTFNDEFLTTNVSNMDTLNDENLTTDISNMGALDEEFLASEGSNTDALDGKLLLAEGSNTDALDGKFLAGAHLSIERSMPENIDKMAQHIQILRERIQGEYKK